jgi:hypothetical protein
MRPLSGGEQVTVNETRIQRDGREKVPRGKFKLLLLHPSETVERSALSVAALMVIPRHRSPIRGARRGIGLCIKKSGRGCPRVFALRP